MNSARYVIEDSGRCYRQNITEQEIDLTPEIMSRFAKEQVVRVKNLFSSAILSSKLGNPVNMAVAGLQAAFTIQLNFLPLRARFTEERKIMVPEFTSGAVAMQLEWVPPFSMRLYLMVVMTPGETNAAEQYVVAVDDQNRMYRLPTTNMHDNCMLCHGKYDGFGITYADCLAKAITQFINSEWGSHLPGTATQLSMSKRMFRFKPLEPEGFEQLEINCDNHWTELCTKVACDALTKFLVI